jgi:hypothetical protein
VHVGRRFSSSFVSTEVSDPLLPLPLLGSLAWLGFVVLDDLDGLLDIGPWNH